MITFETKIWEGDWQKVLRPECIGVNIDRCAHPLFERIVMINNVNDPSIVVSKCAEAYDAGLIDGFVNVDHFAHQALNHFKLSKESFGDGYRYSISELVSIYICRTPYLLHFSGDSMVAEDTPKNWLATGIEVLKRHPAVSVFNLPWNGRHDEVKAESFGEDDDCFYGYGFSDQMYLIRTHDFMNRIYHYKHEGTSAHHHGEIFEKRVDAWMRSEKRPRATLKVGSYLHPTYGD